jgi:predicted flavoprotein YhiN
MALLMTLTTKCPDCGDRSEKKDLIFTSEGLEGDTVMTCSNEKCKRQMAVHWRLSVRTQARRIDKTVLDHQFTIDLSDEEEDERNGEDDASQL